MWSPNGLKFREDNDLVRLEPDARYFRTGGLWVGEEVLVQRLLPLNKAAPHRDVASEEYFGLPLKKRKRRSGCELDR